MLADVRKPSLRVYFKTKCLKKLVDNFKHVNVYIKTRSYRRMLVPGMLNVQYQGVQIACGDGLIACEW
jgi:hypothetical protein